MRSLKEDTLYIEIEPTVANCYNSNCSDPFLVAVTVKTVTSFKNCFDLTVKGTIENSKGCHSNPTGAARSKCPNVKLCKCTGLHKRTNVNVGKITLPLDICAKF